AAVAFGTGARCAVIQQEAPAVTEGTDHARYPIRETTVVGVEEERTMQFLFPWLGQKPDLATLEPLPFCPGVEAGPRPGDHRDAYQVLVGTEPPGDPVPEGIFRRTVEDVRAFRIFPDAHLRGVVPHVPLVAGDTYGYAVDVVPGLQVFCGARVTA